MPSPTDKILSTDINTLQQDVEQTMGSGIGEYGYGQTVLSSPISIGQQIQKSHFDAIRFDIVNIYLHQFGTLQNFIEASKSIPIAAGAGDPINRYQSLINQLRNTRFDLATNQSSGAILIDTKEYDSSVSGTWSSSAEAEITVTFSTATEARHFFNSGGKIRIFTELDTSSIASPTQQTNAWKNLFAGLNVDFGAGTSTLINYYRLTNSYQEYFAKNDSTPYSSNTYILSAKCDVPDNSTGTAKIVTIKIRLEDNYADLGAPPPGDEVQGKLQMTLSEIKADAIAGIKPGNTPFTITSPSYTMSSISVT